MSIDRLSYFESCRRLQVVGLLDSEEPPRMPDGMPRYDDGKPWGVNFFRTLLSHNDLSNLTLPRTYFGRSQVSNVSFRNTDLTESNLCWNDFLYVDFSVASLARCDLRCSHFKRTNITGADLRGADLRRSSFDDCIFAHAILDGTVITRAQAERMALSEAQWAAIDWRDTDGPEPDGG